MTPFDPPLTETEARTVGNTWAFRARSEREATLRFTRLAEELTEVGAEAVVVAMAHEAAADEARHAIDCSEVAKLYGVPGDDPPGPVHRAGPPHLSQRDRVLYEIVAFACITETMNVSLLTGVMETATVPAVRDAAKRIVKDEVQHSRLGWAHLSAEAAKGRGGFLGECLPLMLGVAVEDVLFAADTAPENPALLAHGELPLRSLRGLFVSTLEEVVLPGLATAEARAVAERVRAAGRVVRGRC